MTTPAADLHPFTRALRERTVLFDGAMGTMLYERGVFITQCFEQQNLKKPNLVREVHSAYARAGAEVLETNTFGANRIKLAKHGIEANERREIIQAAVALAREAGGRHIWIAGSMGPAGGKLEQAEARDVFREHAGELLEAGVDLIVLETFRDFGELELALDAVREAGAGRQLTLPIVTFLTPDHHGVVDGIPCEDVARRLATLGVTAGGFNDGAGPDGMFKLMQRMKAAAPELTLAAQPFIGGAETIEDRTIHLATSEFAAVYARRMQREGVRVLGLCCGATPAHIKSMRNALRALQPGSVDASRVDVTDAPGDGAAARALPAASLFGKKIEAGQFAVSVEIDPPHGTDISKALAAAEQLKASGIVDAINIADGPRATARVSPASMALHLKQTVGIEAIIHYCCRDRNLLGMQSDLLGANSLGLLNILLITGDPPKMGDYPDATAVFDVDAIGLTQIVSRLNQGADLAGNPIGAPTQFFPGVGANPGAQDLEVEIERLRRKHEAGARYVMTQPVYDADIFNRFMERAVPIGIPVLIGILPLASQRNAVFLHKNVPGMSIPQPILERMARWDAPDDQRKEGLEIAREALRLARPMVQGTYIMPPFGAAPPALAVLEALR